LEQVRVKEKGKKRGQVFNPDVCRAKAEEKKHPDRGNVTLYRTVRRSKEVLSKER